MSAFIKGAGLDNNTEIYIQHISLTVATKASSVARSLKLSNVDLS